MTANLLTTRPRPSPRPAGAIGYQLRVVRPRRIQQAATACPRPPAQMSLATLIEHCHVETERFYHGKPSDPRYAYELFRRALVEHDQIAWAQIYESYRAMVERWVRRSTTIANSGESSDFFVVETFARFWRAIPPARFSAFPNLAALLHYLRRCASSVVIDHARSQAWAELLPEEAIPPDYGPTTSPDEEALAQLDREAFWHYIDQQLRDQAERAVVYDSFMIGLKPREIYARHGDLFASVNDIYTVKRNVLTRLGNDRYLRGMCE